MGKTVVIDLPNGEKFCGMVCKIRKDRFTVVEPTKQIEQEVFVIDGYYEVRSRVYLKY